MDSLGIPLVVSLLALALAAVGLQLGSRLVGAKRPGFLRACGVSLLSPAIAAGLLYGATRIGEALVPAALALWVLLTYLGVRRIVEGGWLASTVPWLGHALGLAVGMVILGQLLSGMAVARSSRQKRTMADVRNTGVAMMVWQVDWLELPAGEDGGSAEEGSAGEAEESGIDVLFTMADYAPISAAELRELLVPWYLQDLRESDGWKHDLDFRMNREAFAEPMFAIRSAGADGEFQGDVYVVGPFDPRDHEQDIVWADGYFVRWPQQP